MARCFSNYRYRSESFATYACTVIFVAVYLGALVALWVARRKTGPGKRLVGLPYMLALFFMFIDQTLLFLSNTLRACDVDTNINSFYRWQIAITVFSGLHTFLLLFVVIYTLNDMLRKQLGHFPSGLKITLESLLFVLGGLLLSLVAINCYVYHQQINWMSGGYDTHFDWASPYYISLAFDGLLLITLLGSGTLSILAARSLKKKYSTSNSLTIWISILIISLIGYTIISIVQTSTVFTYMYISNAGFVVMSWFYSILNALAYITIIVISKDAAWKSTANVAGARQPQPGYSYQPEEHGFA